MAVKPYRYKYGSPAIQQSDGMAFEGVEEERTATTITRVKIYRANDPKYPSGWRYAFHYGYRDGRGVVRRYDNENETPGRHERHTPDGVTEIDFPGMLELRDRFIDEIESTDGETDANE